MSESWRPSASIQNLRRRAQVLGDIRRFFAERAVLEVETPQLCQHTVTDPHLQGFETTFVGPGAADGLPLYLQTSPEYAMKRLLCAGSGPIFQICKAYRNEEQGRVHNPEFTMLEWYRPGFDHRALMDEVEELIEHILKLGPARRLTYQQAFQQALGIDPLSSTSERLREVATEHSLQDIAAQLDDRDGLLQLLFSHCVEATFDPQVPTFVDDFPASQAALARISDEDSRVAHRFELYIGGLELANGFFELADADEQQRRFEQDNRVRQRLGLDSRAPDHYLLQALSSGLPDCAGVALGIDRLIMLALGAAQIDDVLTFHVGHA